MSDHDEEEAFLTVAQVWREARVSCPHPDLLQAHLSDALDEGAAEFVRFHLVESQCPYCCATVEDFRAREAQAPKAGMQDLRDRLMRSTVAALRKVSGA